jgi:hypothetical protein
MDINNNSIDGSDYSKRGGGWHLMEEDKKDD